MHSLAQSGVDNPSEIFCMLDDLVMNIFDTTQTTVGRKRTLSVSETATIAVLKASYGIKELKQMYRLLKDRFSSDFTLPCYKNFVQSMNDDSTALLILVQILLSFKNKTAGIIKIIDSTAIPVCKNSRIQAHKVMKRLATRSKTTTGWFYGLKLHVITDQKGNLLKLLFTTGNVDDRKALDQFLNVLSHSLILADAGYTSRKLEKKALKRNNLLLTCVRNNMKKIMTPLHHFLLNQRIHVEQLFNVLKERYYLVTSLPRSEKGYLAHYIRVLFGYLFVPIIS